jgi:glycosyltransferase involved in cell wall biosynthesis
MSVPIRVCTPHCGLDPEARLGGEVYEREILRELARRGMVFDILLARHKRLPEELPNWIVHRLPIGRGLRWPVAALLLPPVIGGVYRRTRFDILRAHSLRYIGPAALIARRRYRLDVPIVAHYHHLDRDWLNPLIEAPVVRSVERIVVGSEFARRQVSAELGVSPEKVSVAYYGVDRVFRAAPKPEWLVKRLAPAGQPVALFLGGLETRKNLFFLLDVWREVAREHAEARLIVAGTGPLLSRLQRHAARLGLGERVSFVGHVPEAEKVDYYNLADLLLFPSVMEGFGLVVAEAMSCERPVIVSSRGSLPELVVDGEGGLVCDPTDRGAFVRATLRLLSDPLLRRKLGEASRARVDRLFRWNVCAEATAKIYEEVLAQWRRRPGSARIPA